jgi:hypothetical protein
MNHKTFVDICSGFAAARPAARSFRPQIDAEIRFLPALAGGLVRNEDDPEDGFATAAEARSAARLYRDSCREALASAQRDDQRRTHAQRAA